MSAQDYQASREIVANDPTFYSLIMAAMRRADTHNLRRLMAAFPDQYVELVARYEAPGGLLAGEYPDPELPAASEEADDELVKKRIVIRGRFDNVQAWEDGQAAVMLAGVNAQGIPDHAFTSEMLEELVDVTIELVPERADDAE